MHPRCSLSINRATVVEASDDVIQLSLNWPESLQFRRPRRGVRALVELLRTSEMTADELCRAAALDDAPEDYTRVYYALAALEKKGLVRYRLLIDGEPLVSVEPSSHRFSAVTADPSCLYQASRFTCLRREGSGLVVDAPLGYARVFVQGCGAAAVLALMARPSTAAQLAHVVPEIDPDAALAVLSLLCSVGAVFRVFAGSRLDEDDSLTLRQWEFHDLLFHTRSRAGRHGQPRGNTFRFYETLRPLPAVKPRMSTRCIALGKPNLRSPQFRDSSFNQVSESRCSIRSREEAPLDARALGEFLFRCARVKNLVPPDEASGRLHEASHRICAGGGGMHSLELYVTVGRCEDIAAGLYHYDPQHHVLEHLCDRDGAQQTLLTEAQVWVGAPDIPDVVITLAARFQRMAWKYESVAYALILKDVGALIQQMYLVATAMGLAPCALGDGDSDRFAEAAGLDYYTETSVGEFMLSRGPATAVR